MKREVAGNYNDAMSLSQLTCSALLLVSNFITSCPASSESPIPGMLTPSSEVASTQIVTPTRLPITAQLLPVTSTVTITPERTATLPRATLAAVPPIVQTVTPIPRVGLAATAQMHNAHVPILMYHYISTPPRNADRYRINLSVKPEDLEAQLRYLSENNYQTIGLYDLYAHLANGASLPAKPVVLTFDDGYRDAYEYAFPLLTKYKMKATFFIITDFINSGNPAHLTWAMVRKMSDAGMNMESHSRSHPDMRNRSFEFLVWQILGPIEAITAYTGRRPHFFCYPSGQYDDAVIRVLRSVETWGAVTTRMGYQHTLEDAMLWPRMRIHGSTSLSEFATMVK